METIGVFDIKELRKIYYELERIAEQEATKLYRLVWRAKAHGCSEKTISEIRDEAHRLHTIGNPASLLAPYTCWKYAFKCERRVKRWLK